MKYICIIIVILGTFFLAYHYIQYLKETRGTESYAKRRIVTLLFLGFLTLVGISSIFAEAIFEFLNLSKPLYFELITLIAYAIFSTASVLIISKNSNSKEASKSVYQNHSGSGDNVAGDKIINP